MSRTIRSNDNVNKNIESAGFIRWRAWSWGGTVETSDCQFGHGALQGVAGPVLMVPAQEPSGKGGRLIALLDFDDGRPVVPVGRVGLNVTDRWGRRGHLGISANQRSEQRDTIISSS